MNTGHFTLEVLRGIESEALISSYNFRSDGTVRTHLHRIKILGDMANPRWSSGLVFIALRLIDL